MNTESEEWENNNTLYIIQYIINYIYIYNIIINIAITALITTNFFDIHNV